MTLKIAILTTRSMPGILAMQDFVEDNAGKISAIYVLPNVPESLSVRKEKLFSLLRRLPFTVLFYKILETSIYYSLRSLFGLPTPFSLGRKLNIPVKAVDDPNDEGFRTELAKAGCDLVFNISPSILREPFLRIPRIGCINFHGGILPEWGGVANHFWVLIHDLPETGSTAHFMTPAIDAGDIVGVQRFAITPSDTVHSVNVKNNVAFNILMQAIVDALERGDLPRKSLPPGVCRTFPTRKEIAGLSQKHKLFTIKDFVDSVFLKPKGRTA